MGLLLPRSESEPLICWWVWRLAGWIVAGGARPRLLMGSCVAGSWNRCWLDVVWATVQMGHGRRAAGQRVELAEGVMLPSGRLDLGRGDSRRSWMEDHAAVLDRAVDGRGQGLDREEAAELDGGRWRWWVGRRRQSSLGKMEHGGGGSSAGLAGVGEEGAAIVGGNGFGMARWKLEGSDSACHPLHFGWLGSAVPASRWSSPPAAMAAGLGEGDGAPYGCSGGAP
ncbi:hypothetical protein ACLOJK_020614 [Asimina triloba]